VKIVETCLAHTVFRLPLPSRANEPIKQLFTCRVQRFMHCCHSSHHLYGFVIVRFHHRDLVWINVTTNPTAEWVARQITEAFLWDGAPRYMI
jgi:hypothetical protein